MTKGRGRYISDRVSLWCHMPGLHRSGMEPGKEQQHSLLSRKEHLLPEVLSTRKQEGQVLTAQPAVLPGPPCIDTNTIYQLYAAQVSGLSV